MYVRHGRAALLFDGTDDVLFRTQSAANLVYARTMYAVAASGGDNAGARTIFGYGSSSDATEYEAIDLLSNALRSVTRGGAGGAQSASGFDFSGDTDPHLIESRWLSKDDRRNRVDGANEATDSGVIGLAPLVDRASIGANNYAGFINYHNGYVAEIIEASADLTTAQRNAIGRYLSHKWGHSYTDVS